MTTNSWEESSLGLAAVRLGRVTGPEEEKTNPERLRESKRIQPLPEDESESTDPIFSVHYWFLH